MNAATRQRRRIGAYGLCRDEAGRVLLVRASVRSARPGTWFLPGGGVEQGEDPADAVLRELAEETGLAGQLVGVRDAAAELVVRPPYLEHTDGVIYDLRVTGGALRPELAGSSDLVRWVAPAEAATLPLSRFATHALGLPPPAAPPVPAEVGAAPARPGRRVQRFAAYALVTDPAGRVLLTRNADGYPGAGRWHLPGGGTDFGEQPRDGLRREITEESGQQVRITGVLSGAHLHNPGGVSRQGSRIDWHGVMVVFRATVADPTPLRVLERDGSTAAAAWFARPDLAALPLTGIAADTLAADW